MLKKSNRIIVCGAKIAPKLHKSNKCLLYTMHNTRKFNISRVTKSTLVTQVKQAKKCLIKLSKFDEEIAFKTKCNRGTMQYMSLSFLLLEGLFIYLVMTTIERNFKSKCQVCITRYYFEKLVWCSSNSYQVLRPSMIAEFEFKNLSLTNKTIKPP